MTTYTDLNIHFDLHPIKKDITVLEDVTAITASFKRLILTNHYEIPFKPDVGSNVKALLFENVTPITASYLVKEIKNIATNYEPRIKIKDIYVTAVPDRNYYSISIEFESVLTQKPLNMEFKLNRLR